MTQGSTQKVHRTPAQGKNESLDNSQEQNNKNSLQTVKTYKLTVYYASSRGINTKFDYLVKSVHIFKYDIFTLRETWLKPNVLATYI